MENQRIRLSKAMLKQALIMLLEHKPIEKITIYELCAEAQINRTTFYKYYGSQYDLLLEIETDFFNALQEHLTSAQTELEGLVQFLRYLDAEPNNCRALLNASSGPEFIEKLFDLPVIRELLGSHIHADTPRQAAHLRLFFCHGGYALIRDWLNDDHREPPEELAALLSMLDMKLLQG